MHLHRYVRNTLLMLGVTLLFFRPPSRTGRAAARPAGEGRRLAGRVRLQGHVQCRGLERQRDEGQPACPPRRPRGRDIALDLSGARVHVADVNGDGVQDAADLHEGDIVAVKAYAPRRGRMPQRSPPAGSSRSRTSAGRPVAPGVIAGPGSLSRRPQSPLPCGRQWPTCRSTLRTGSGAPRWCSSPACCPTHRRAVRQARDVQPGGSVKDRIGVAMIEAAEREGRIEPGRTTIVEATAATPASRSPSSCAAKGYELILTLPAGHAASARALLRLYGAKVHVTSRWAG